MTLLVRLLPLVTVAAWVMTLFVPVFDSGNDVGPRIVMNSLGTDLDFLDDPWSLFIATWVGVVGCAVSVWFSRRPRVWWSIVAMLVAVLIGIFVAMVLENPPVLLWDGVDAQGRPIGGFEKAGPAAGTVVWGIGLVALFTAGVCGLVGSRSRGDSQLSRGTGV